MSTSRCSHSSISTDAASKAQDHLKPVPVGAHRPYSDDDDDDGLGHDRVATTFASTASNEKARGVEGEFVVCNPGNKQNVHHYPVAEELNATLQTPLHREGTADDKPVTTIPLDSDAKDVATAPVADASSRVVSAVSLSSVHPQLHNILQRFHEQIHRIDGLERRVDERAIRVRRRMACLLETAPAARASHVRIFVTHQYASQQQQQPSTSSSATDKTTTKESIVVFDQPQSPSTSLGTKPADPVGSQDLVDNTNFPKSEDAKATAPGGDIAEDTGDDRKKMSNTSTSVKDESEPVEITSKQETATRPTEICTQSAYYTLCLEGQLLIGHLDHVSAQQYDRRIKYVAPTDDLDRSRGGEKEEEELFEPVQFTHLMERLVVTFLTVYQPKTLLRLSTGNNNNSSGKKSKKTTSKSPVGGTSTSSTVTSYPIKKKSTRRGGGGTTASPPPSSSTAAAIPDAVGADGDATAAGDTGATTAAIPGDDAVDWRTCRLSDLTRLEWHKQQSDSKDSHAWQVHYTPPPPPADNYMVHSVVAWIELYQQPPCNQSINNSSNTSDAAITTTASLSNIPISGSNKAQLLAHQNSYTIINPDLVQALFPNHGIPTEPLEPDPSYYSIITDRHGSGMTAVAGGGVGSGAAASDTSLASPTMTSKKRKAEEQNSDSMRGGGITTTADGYPIPPTETQIQVTPTLTMSEIIASFFTYIQDHHLNQGVSDDSDHADQVRHIFRCDAVLEKLLGVDRLSFDQLQATLLTRNLIARVVDPLPTRLVYILKEDTAMPNSDTAVPSKQDTTNANLFQLDLDCAIPSLFPCRARELMRRIKRRELEYTSSRTKGRYILTARKAKDEDSVKAKIDWVVAGKAHDADLQPVLLALARAAPPHTEARMASYLDARISYLLERLQEHYQAAVRTWELVQAFQRHIQGAVEDNVEEDNEQM